MESEDDYLTSDAELDTDVEEDLDPGQEQELGVWLDQLNAFQQVRQGGDNRLEAQPNKHPICSWMQTPELHSLCGVQQHCLLIDTITLLHTCFI